MKIIGRSPPRHFAAILLLGSLVFGLWYLQSPPTAPVLSPASPASSAMQRREPPPASQAPSKAELGKLASPDSISSRAAEKVKAYADVRRKLRSDEITTLPADLAPPPIPAPIEIPATNP